MTKKYKLNPLAHIFFDSANGVKIMKGEEKEITQAMISRSKRLKSAIASRHIIECVTETSSNSNTPTTVEEYITIIENLIKANTPVDKIAKRFKLETLKSICEHLEIEPEENDTKNDLMEVIVSELNPSSDDTHKDEDEDEEDEDDNEE